MNAGNFYEYPNGVLRNKYGIQDAAQLASVEAAATLLRIAYIQQHPIPGSFDLVHLQAIHQYLFQDVYAWAGEVRLVEISKGNSQFALIAYLAQNAATIFARLVQEQHLRGMTFDAFAQRAAYYLGELNALHPFREGNGRTQRAFLSQLAHAAGYLLHWERITADQMIDASVLSLAHGDNSGFADILHTSMVLILP